MNTKEANYKTFMEENTRLFLPCISIECIILGFHDRTLKVLLNKSENNRNWMLPGGVIYLNENVNNAAYRILLERTGLKEAYLKQFYLFGDIGKVQPERNRHTLANTINHAVKDSLGLLDRLVSLGYYALVEYSQIKIKPEDAHNVQWFEINELPKLYGDHNQIIKKALKSVRSQINTTPIAAGKLLAEKFTISELRVVYETILDRKLDRRNFQRKVLASRFIIKLNEVSRKLGCKSATLFTIDKEKYNLALTDETVYCEW